MRKRLYVVPIEPLEERYSKQWLAWTQQELEKLIPGRFNVIIPAKWHMNYRKIERGAFLDVCKTHVFKFAQLQILSQMLTKGDIKDGDVIWFHDMWFPGLEALAYMRQGVGIDFKIAGCLHAGTYDPHDFLTKKGMGPWAKPLENCWLELVDMIFVATNFHKTMLTQSRYVNPAKVHVTGFPIYQDNNMRSKANDDPRCDAVVFPHRLDDEKQPFLFDQLECECACHDIPGTMLNNLQFVKTKEVAKDKADYYRILRQSKYAVSFALQETWGIAMQEAVLCRCVPIVPNRLSYSEMYHPMFHFDGTVMDCVDTLHKLSEIPNDQMLHFLNDQRKKLLDAGACAIPHMVHIMEVK